MKIDRLIAEIMLLLEQDQINAKYLADMFEVSKRTIYRDMDSINQAGIPIVATSGPGNGISILKSYKVEKKLFSTNDITTLLMALGSIQSNLPSNEITTTLAKIKGMVPSEKREELNFKSNQIKIDLFPWLYSGSSLDKIQLVKEAMDQQHLLRFEYKDNKKKWSTREVEPYCLLLKGEFWYLQGYCLLRKDFRTFKILRIRELRIVELPFTLRDFPGDKLKKVDFNDKTFTQVTLRIHEDIMDKIISRFGEDCLTPDAAEYYKATVLMPIEEIAIDYLLSFGNKCECLYPESVREELRQASYKIYSMYNKDTILY